jgi:hypothetical protein
VRRLPRLLLKDPKKNDRQERDVLGWLERGSLARIQGKASWWRTYATDYFRQTSLELQVAM